MRIFDVTRPVDESLIIWRGQMPPEILWVSNISLGGYCNASQLRMSVHTGTHMDAPLHFVDDGKAIHQIPFGVFIGECTVVDLRSTDILVMGEELASKYRGVKRLLIRTNHSYSGNGQLYEPHDRLITPAATTLLVDSGLVLIGTDRLSVDDSRGDDFSLHHQLLEAGCVILEGLLLKDVEPKRYFLYAPPLLLPGREASPVRALLMETDQ